MNKQKNRVFQQVYKTIRKYHLINQGDIVVLGLSGGADSVCLFDVLLKLSVEMGFALYATHINHNLRANAIKDEVFVRNLCKAKGVQLEVLSEDIEKLAYEKNMSTELVARQVRYEFFDKVATRLSSEMLADMDSLQNGILIECTSQINDIIKFKDDALDIKNISKPTTAITSKASQVSNVNNITTISTVSTATKFPTVKIATAHNSDDQIETVLFRMIRGTGIDGIAGMQYIRKSENSYDIIKPLLDVSKSEVFEYCAENGLEYCTDETNAQPIYTRNKIRLELLPYLRDNFNENIADSLRRLSDNARNDSEYLWQVAREKFDDAVVCKNNTTVQNNTQSKDSGIELDEKLKNGTVSQNEKDFQFQKSYSKSMSVSLRLAELQNLYPAILYRVLLQALEIIGLNEDVTHRHLQSMGDIITKGITPLSVDLPMGYRAYIAYDKLVCEKILQSNSSNMTKQNFKIDIEVININEKPEVDDVDIANVDILKDIKTQFVTSDTDNNSKSLAKILLDAEKLCEVYGENAYKNICVRIREAGDFIKLPKTEGNKKIKKMFVDMKIVGSKREEIPLLCIGHEVLCAIIPNTYIGNQTLKNTENIAGYKLRYTDNYKVTEATSKALQVEIYNLL